MMCIKSMLVKRNLALALFSLSRTSIGDTPEPHES